MSAEGAAVIFPVSGRRGGTWRLFALGCLAVVALSLVLDPVNPSHGVVPCPFRRVTGLPCPGCGITRAMTQCGHGQIAESVRFHPLGPAVWLAAFVGATSLVWPRRWREGLGSWYGRHRVTLERVMYVGIGLLTLFGVVRIIFVLTGAPVWWLWAD